MFRNFSVKTLIRLITVYFSITELTEASRNNNNNIQIICCGENARRTMLYRNVLKHKSHQHLANVEIEIQNVHTVYEYDDNDNDDDDDDFSIALSSNLTVGKYRCRGVYVSGRRIDSYFVLRTAAAAQWRLSRSPIHVMNKSLLRYDILSTCNCSTCITSANFLE